MTGRILRSHSSKNGVEPEQTEKTTSAGTPDSVVDAEQELATETTFLSTQTEAYDEVYNPDCPECFESKAMCKVCGVKVKSGRWNTHDRYHTESELVICRCLKENGEICGFVAIADDTGRIGMKM